MFLIATVRFRVSRFDPHSLEGAVPLYENVPASVVDHDLGDRRIAEEILDRFQERQNPVKAAHNCPRATWSK